MPRIRWKSNPIKELLLEGRTKTWSFCAADLANHNSSRSLSAEIVVVHSNAKQLARVHTYKPQCWNCRSGLEPEHMLNVYLDTAQSNPSSSLWAKDRRNEPRDPVRGQSAAWTACCFIVVGHVQSQDISGLEIVSCLGCWMQKTWASWCTVLQIIFETLRTVQTKHILNKTYPHGGYNNISGGYIPIISPYWWLLPYDMILQSPMSGNMPLPPPPPPPPHGPLVP
jgi:hypothetical protein